MIKSLRVNLITIIVIIFLVLLNPPLREKETVMFVESQAIMHLNVDIARVMTILLGQGQTWPKEMMTIMILLPRSLLKLIL
jgi:hypothetical protein